MRGGHRVGRVTLLGDVEHDVLAVIGGVVDVDDHALVHDGVERVFTQIGHGARVAALARRVGRQGAAGSFQQQRGERIVAGARNGCGHLGPGVAHGRLVLGVGTALGGFPETAGVEEVEEVDDVAAEDAGAAQRAVDVMEGVDMAHAQLPQPVDLFADLLLVAFTHFDAAGQHGHAAVEDLRHLDAEHHRQLAVVDDGARFLRTLDDAEPAFARPAILRIDVVLDLVKVFDLLGRHAGVVAVCGRGQRIQFADLTQGGDVGAVVDDQTQAGQPGALDPLVIHHLMGQEIALRPANEGRPALGIVGGARRTFEKVVGVADALRTVKIGAIFQRMRYAETMEHLAVKHATSRRADVAGIGHFAGHAHVRVHIGKADHRLIHAAALEGFAADRGGHLRVGAARFVGRHEAEGGIVGTTAAEGERAVLGGDQAQPGALRIDAELIAGGIVVDGPDGVVAELSAGLHGLAISTHGRAVGGIEQILAECGGLHEKGFTTDRVRRCSLVTTVHAGHIVAAAQ